MPNPFLMKNMSKAVARLLLAKKRGEKIGLWGDYDGDGIPGTVLLYEGFQRAGFDKNKLVISLPDTLKSGHGFNTAQLEYLHDAGATLLITVDFGVGETEGVQSAKKLGMDVIVLDHHLPPKQLPKAIIVNPKQKGDRYSFADFSGTGVAYKFLEAVFSALRIKSYKLREFCDLAALAAIFDRVPIKGENASLVKRGLNEMNSRPRVGIRALKKLLRLKKITVKNVWEIIERLASVQGINKENNIFRFLTAEDEKSAKKIIYGADKLVRAYRKEVDNAFFEGLKKFRAVPPKKVIVWRRDANIAGVLGEVAAKLYEVFKLPIFLYSLKENKKSFKGSARAPKGYNLVQVLDTCSTLFMKYGGHPQAAGYDFPKSREKEFIKCVNSYFNKHGQNSKPETF